MPSSRETMRSGSTRSVSLVEDSADVTQLKSPYPSDEMICWPVSSRVGNVKNNSRPGRAHRRATIERRNPAGAAGRPRQGRRNGYPDRRCHVIRFTRAASNVH
jgi:hypothetical protein